MMSEYIAEHLADKEVAVHLRLGMPVGVSVMQPNWEWRRRLFMATLPEADLVYRDNGLVWILEFAVWRPQVKMGQLLVYKQLLPKTPGYWNTPEDRIRLKLVLGRREPVVENVAKAAGIEIEIYQPEWLKKEIARRTGKWKPGP